MLPLPSPSHPLFLIHLFQFFLLFLQKHWLYFSFKEVLHCITLQHFSVPSSLCVCNKNMISFTETTSTIRTGDVNDGCKNQGLCFLPPAIVPYLVLWQESSSNLHKSLQPHRLAQWKFNRLQFLFSCSNRISHFKCIRINSIYTH